MRNPWEQLPLQAPYALAGDRRYIDEFNKTASREVAIHLELLPEPFLGAPSAPVVLLNLNPGFDERDPVVHHDQPDFIAASRNNLVHGEVEFPFYLLNPVVADSPGGQWWRKKLGPPIKECGLRAVSQRVLCVEHFPYHSKKFKPLRTRLDSQLYGFRLVAEAINRGAIIVVMRSEESWVKAVPALRKHDKLYRLKNPQNVIVSPGNCPDGFGEIIAAVTASSSTA